MWSENQMQRELANAPLGSLFGCSELAIGRRDLVSCGVRGSCCKSCSGELKWSQHAGSLCRSS